MGDINGGEDGCVRETCKAPISGDCYDALDIAHEDFGRGQSSNQVKILRNNAS